MLYGEKRVEKPIRWAMVGGGLGSQIGYIHRSAALRDFSFELVAGAFDILPERGKEFGKNLHVAEDRCYPDNICPQLHEGSFQIPFPFPEEYQRLLQPVQN